jgi:hypothetical protein
MTGLKCLVGGVSYKNLAISFSVTIPIALPLRDTTILLIIS